MDFVRGLCARAITSGMLITDYAGQIPAVRHSALRCSGGCQPDRGGTLGGVGAWRRATTTTVFSPPFAHPPAESDRLRRFRKAKRAPVAGCPCVQGGRLIAQFGNRVNNWAVPKPPACWVSWAWRPEEVTCWTLPSDRAKLPAMSCWAAGPAPVVPVRQAAVLT